MTKDYDIAGFILLAILAIIAWCGTIFGVFYLGYKIMFALTD